MMEVEVKRKTRIKPYFKWFDCWVGIYFDTEHHAMYIGFLPMLGIKVWEGQVAICPGCGQELTKSAYNTGDGWSLFWECVENYNCRFNGTEELECDWAFADAWMTGRDLERHGFTIV